MVNPLLQMPNYAIFECLNTGGVVFLYCRAEHVSTLLPSLMKNKSCYSNVCCQTPLITKQLRGIGLKGLENSVNSDCTYSQPFLTQLHPCVS